MTRTATGWLALGDELGVELATAMIGLKHDWIINKDHARLCSKCGVGYAVGFPCVPDPITIDWNTAMEWRDKTCGIDDVLVDPTRMRHLSNKFYYTLLEVMAIAIDCPSTAEIVCKAQPKHYLIAAAMSKDKEI